MGSSPARQVRASSDHQSAALECIDSRTRTGKIFRFKMPRRAEDQGPSDDLPTTASRYPGRWSSFQRMRWALWPAAGIRRPLSQFQPGLTTCALGSSDARRRDMTQVDGLQRARGRLPSEHWPVWGSFWGSRHPSWTQNLVEAAGVEPASEAASPGISTSVSRTLISPGVSS